MKNSHRFFNNAECRYFPCHETDHPERFNCLFCYCPLYFLDDCGGRFKRMANGLKDCTACRIPHEPEAYDHILNKLRACFRTGARLVMNPEPPEADEPPPEG
jgi:Zn-finger protein